jgi:glycosyltransferase involved in cell wall biosynthesis
VAVSRGRAWVRARALPFVAVRICYVADARSVHTQRWVRWFARRHDVRLVRTSPCDSLPDVSGLTLPQSSWWPGGRLAASVAALREVVRTFRPDLLHAHYINEGGWLGAASLSRPFVLTAWGSDVYVAPLQSRLAAVLNPWAARRADHVTCDSADQMARLRAWGVRPERISMIGWGVDTASFRPGLDRLKWRRRLGIPESARVILSPRQWLPNSNIEAAVRAHEVLGGDSYLVLKRIPRFETEHADDVDRAVRTSLAADRIRVVSEIAEEELPELYAAADCLVTLCASDGTPVSLLEGMAVGLPIVAFGIPSLVEWVRWPGGLTVASLAPEEIATALDRILCDAAARADAAGHNVAVIASRANRQHEMERAEALCTSLAKDR